ncbi:glycosyltransferase family 39 protein [Opitutus sp. ER46]|uniref:glycosyltransferase family 39 protein n=1 Tax=Opitutus sp. ER46 TaxID=2161864 RepID=UPI000D3105F9|nr:glycosyltransferase family 39 protein [Opitutus sp. ER46]PTX98592.1 hypothetical protein DB354_04830 [Opitutus sp. ER46]
MLSPRLRSVLPWLLAVSVLVFGVTLRFVYFDNVHGQSDEAITLGVVQHLRTTSDWDNNWIKADLSEDLRRNQYNFSTHLYATYLFDQGVRLIPGLEGWRTRDSGFHVFRFFVALLGAAVVLLSFNLARRLLDFSTAVVATLFVAVAPLLVQDAHYIRPEPLTTALTLGAILLCVPTPRFSSWRVLGAGFLLGLLIACKVSLLILAWLPLVPLLGQPLPLGRRVALAAATFCVLALGFAVGAPGAMLHPAAYLSGIRDLMTQYAGVHPPHSHIDGGWTGDMMLRYFGSTLGWTTFALFIFGLVRLAVLRRWVVLALAAVPVLLFGGYFATRSVFFERNLSHVLPLFLILAAWGLVELVRLAHHRSLRLAVPLAAVLLVAALARPASVTARLIGQEYSGQANAAHDRIAQVAAEQHSDAAKWEELLLVDEPLRRLAAHFQDSSQPVLLRIADYADEGTAANLARLRREFVVETIANHPGTFPELPTCTLLTYHMSRVWFLRVTGPRPRS